MRKREVHTSFLALFDSVQHFFLEDLSSQPIALCTIRLKIFLSDQNEWNHLRVCALPRFQPGP